MVTSEHGSCQVIKPLATLPAPIFLPSRLCFHTAHGNWPTPAHQNWPTWCAEVGWFWQRQESLWMVMWIKQIERIDRPWSKRWSSGWTTEGWPANANGDALMAKATVGWWRHWRPLWYIHLDFRWEAMIDEVVGWNRGRLCWGATC